jgi:hypothetical protein
LSNVTLVGGGIVGMTVADRLDVFKITLPFDGYLAHLALLPASAVFTSQKRQGCTNAIGAPPWNCISATVPPLRRKKQDGSNSPERPFGCFAQMTAFPCSCVMCLARDLRLS